MMINLLARIFVISFFINLLYELLHSVLYKTCLEAPLPRYLRLMLKAAAFDGLFIAILYYVVILAFNEIFWRAILFLIVSLLFAYIWEKYSLKKKKWEYSNKMPLILGVGITPLIQLALTGIISIYLSIKF